MSTSKSIIHGRLTRDPEFTPANADKNQYCKFTVAVNRSYGDSADFWDCVAFGRRAEVINKYFSRGSEIIVIGRHECDPYTTKDGTKRYPWTLKVDDFDFCGSGNGANKEQPEPAVIDGVESDSFENVEDDIPWA